MHEKLLLATQNLSSWTCPLVSAFTTVLMSLPQLFGGRLQGPHQWFHLFQPIYCKTLQHASENEERTEMAMEKPPNIYPEQSKFLQRILTVTSARLVSHLIITEDSGPFHSFHWHHRCEQICSWFSRCRLWINVIKALSIYLRVIEILTAFVHLCNRKKGAFLSAIQQFHYLALISMTC